MEEKRLVVLHTGPERACPSGLRFDGVFTCLHLKGVCVCGLPHTWPLCLHERVAEIAQGNGRACVCKLLPVHGVERDDEATLG